MEEKNASSTLNILMYKYDRKARQSCEEDTHMMDAGALTQSDGKGRQKGGKLQRQITPQRGGPKGASKGFGPSASANRQEKLKKRCF